MINVSLVISDNDTNPLDFSIDDDTLQLIDQLVGTGFGFNRAEVIKNVLEHALRRNESIGRCELCGRVDHHMVEGACPRCRKLYGLEKPTNKNICNLPLPGDRLFSDSPDAGHPDCICSRCLEVIGENEVPLRFFHESTCAGEWRYHEKCAGI